MKHTLESLKSKTNVPIHIIHAEGTEIIEFRLYFQAGFSYFSQVDHHVPHMLEHLLFGQNPDSQEVRNLTHDLQRLGAVANASTDNDYVTIMLTAPVTTGREALERILKSITDPDFSEAAVESERQIVLRELYERNDGVGAAVGGQLIGSLMAPIAPTELYQEASGINAISVATVRQAYADYIHGSNLKVVASGAIDAQLKIEIVDLISKYFISETSKRKERHPLDEISKTIIITNSSGDTNNSSVMMALIQENNLSPRERVARSVAINMLFSTTDAIIPRTLRSLGYVYSIDIDSIGYGNKEIVCITLAANSDKLPSAIVEIYSLLKLYSITPYPADEFESIKLYAEHIIPTLNETPADLIGWYEPKFLHGAAKTSPEDEVRLVKSLKAEDIAKSVKNNFISKVWHWGVISPDSQIWAASLHEKLNNKFNQKKSLKRFKQLAQEEVALIPDLRTHANREFWTNITHVIFLIGFYPVLLTLAFAINFPNVASSGSISYAHFAIETKNVLIGALTILPLCVIGITGYWKNKDFRKSDAALGLIAAAAYWYAVVKIFGSTGVESSTFLEKSANVIQPLFFGFLVPMYAIMVLWSEKAARRLSRAKRV